MQTCDLVLSISALACKLAEGKTLEEIRWTSAFFVQLGETLDMIAAQQELCSANSEKKA